MNIEDLGAQLLTVPPSAGAALATRLRRGVVTQVSPLLVRVGAATTAVPATALNTYVPIANDVVSVLEVDGDRLVLGATSPTNAWQTPSFLNGWTNLGSGHRPLRYRRVGDDVRIEGSITGGTLNTYVCSTLPVGYRPTTIHRFGLADGGIFQVDSTGGVAVFAASNTVASFSATWSVT